MNRYFIKLLFYLFINTNIFTLIESFNLNNLNQTQTESAQPSTYRLIGSTSSHAQYLPWYPCLNGSIAFEFKTHEPNGLLLYAQSLPYKYIQLSLTDGNLRLRMRIGEKDNPRGVFLVHQAAKLNDEKWHEVKISRENEKTLLTIDGQNLYHIHKDANLDGYDLYFGEIPFEQSLNLLVLGGLPNTIQTYDLSLGTALFEHRFNGFIRNVRSLNCSSDHIARMNVISSNNLRFVTEQDSCLSNPCQNKGVCLTVSDSSNSFKCDCSSTNFEGKFCEKCKCKTFKKRDR